MSGEVAGHGPSTMIPKTPNNREVRVTLTRVITAYVTSSLGANQSADIEWRYNGTDPLVVRMVIDPDSGESWILGRDLLAEALLDRTDAMHGEGDVQAQSDGAWIRVYLTSPKGTAQVRMIRQDMIDFIDATIKIVGPDGAETKIIQDELDVILPKILGEAKEV